MKREDVYKLIDEERNYQDTLSSDAMEVGEELALMKVYLDKAFKEWAEDFNQPEQEALAMVRKLAGICARCMEHHGAPKR